MSTASIIQPVVRVASTIRPPGTLSSVALRRVGPYGGGATRPARFVMQSHSLGAPAASPRSLLIAATVAVALYLIGRRLSR